MPASKGAVNLDTVLIEIESNAGKAAGNISELANHLNVLKTSVKGGFNNINKLAESLNKLAPALEKLNKLSGNLRVIGEITSSLAQLKDIKSPTGLKNTVDSLEKLPQLLSKMDTKTFENLTRVSKELAQALTPLADKMQKIADGYSAFSKIQNTFGKSASTVSKYTKQQKSIFSSLGSVLKKTGSLMVSLGKSVGTAFGKYALSNMKKFRSQAKQIFLSLLGTRTLFTMIRKAASEYQAFDQTLQDFSQNVWRAFGAQLAPVLYYVMDLFKQFVRVIYSVILALTGIDLISKANQRAMASWGKSTKDTLGNLQKFDDLNVVEFDKGKSGDDNKLIELDTIDLSPIQKVIDWVKKLKAEIKEAWASGEWGGVGEVFAEGVNEGLKYLLTALPKIKKTLFNIVTNFTEFLNAAILNINWKDFGNALTQVMTMIPNLMTHLLMKTDWTAIGDGLKEFFEGFNLGLYIRVKADTWVTFVKGLGEALSRVDWTAVGKDLGEAVKQALLGINRILGEINFKEVGAKLREVLINMDWKEIGNQIVIMFKNVFTGIGEFLQGLFDVDIDADTLTKGAIAITLVIGAFVLLKKVVSGLFSTKKTVNETVKSFGNMFENFGKAAGTIALLGGMALVIKEISGLLKTFSESNMSTGDAIKIIATTFGMLAVAFIGLALAVNTMDWQAMVAGLVMLGGMAAVFGTLSSLFESISATGFTASETMGVLGVVMGSVIALITAMTIAAMALQNPLAMAGVAVVVAAIAAVMFTLKETLPTILDACGKFINQIAPPIIELVTVIGTLINEIIRSLGVVLPPIINSVGNLFTRIFNGIANVINTVGNVIVRIMNTAANNVTKVLKAIIKFINDLGPAINNFVDNAIVAVTKLVNFVVSAMEYLINTAIVKPINKLVKKVNDNAIAEKLGWQLDTIGTVNIDRFAPKLETGTNEIPYEGIYHLHPGEAVVPKKYNPALGNGGSDEMNQKLDTLIDIMNNMNFTNVVNIGNKRVYEGQQAYNKTQQNKYGTINLY